MLAEEMFQLYREKELETQDFESVISQANEEKNTAAKSMIKNFERELKQVLMEVKDQESDAIEEDEQKLDRLKKENESMTVKLLEMEVTRVEQFSVCRPTLRRVHSTHLLSFFFCRMSLTSTLV